MAETITADKRMNMRHEPYANTDPSLHYNRIEPLPSERWHGAWLWCLRHFDYDGAQLILDRNVPLSHECHFGDHDYCRIPSCGCVCHRATVVKIEHTTLKSCREVAIEQAEQEFEASLR